MDWKIMDASLLSFNILEKTKKSIHHNGINSWIRMWDLGVIQIWAL